MARTPHTTSALSAATSPSRAARTPRRAPVAAPVLAVAVSVKTRTLIDHVREEFAAFAKGFDSLTIARAELAPRFMKAFTAWAGETSAPFVAFVRLLDPDVPESRDGYRAHATYQAADYLRRLVAQQGRKREPVADDERPVSIYQALAHLVATVMPAVDPTGVIWSAFVKEMNWDESQSNRVKVMAAKLGAVKLPPTVKHRLAHAAA